MSDSNGARNVTTPRLGLNKPAVGADLDIWGDYLNANCDTLDNSFLVSGGIFTGAVAGYPTSSAGAPAFSVSSGAGIYAQGASMGVASFNTNVFVFSLSNNQSSVPLSMANNRIMNLANPVLGTDAVNLNTVASMGSAYLPVAGGQMLGPINMGGNLLTGLALPQNPADATSKQYVDALIADMRLFVDTWQVAANIPDISNISSITAGDYYIAVTANPTVPETAPSNIPGIGGMTINNGDMVIYSEATAQYELVRGGPLTVAEADALFVNKAGDTMSGGLTINSTSGLTLRQNPVGGVQGINYAGFGALGENIAFGISMGVLYVYQNAVAVAGLLNLSGGTMTGGLSFGSALASAPGDLSRHINLYGSGYGFSVTADTLNHFTTGQHIFYAGGGQQIVTIDGAGLTVNIGSLTAPGANLTGGLSFGSRLAASVTDLTQHLGIWAPAIGGPPTYGINITSGRVNYVVAPGASHVFIAGGADRLTIAPASATLTAPLTIIANSALALQTGNYPTVTLRATASTPASAWQIHVDPVGRLNFYEETDPGVYPFRITRTEVNALAPFLLSADATAPMQAVTLRQMQAAIDGGGGGPWLPLTGGTIDGDLQVINGTTTQFLAVTASATANSIVVAAEAVAGTIRSNGGSYYASAGDDFLTFNAANNIWSFITNSAIVASLTAAGLWTVASVLETGGVLQMRAPVNYLQNNASGTWAFVNNNVTQATLDSAGNFIANASITATTALFIGAPAAGFFLSVGGDGNPVLQFRPNIYLESEANNSLIYNIGTSTPGWRYDIPTGNYFCYSGAFVGNAPFVDLMPPLGTEQHAAPISHGLAEVLQLRPVSFTRPLRAGYPAQPTEIGFLAAEVQPIVPEAVVEHEIDGELMLGLRESSLLAVTVNAIKELDARLRALEGVSRRVH